MSELTDEEFKKFITDNRERILDILQESIPTGEDVDRAFEPAERMKAETEARIRARREEAAEAAREVYSAFVSPDVHRHFIRMGMELFMGLNEFVSRLPVPDGVRQFKEDLDQTQSELRKEMCRNNPDCMMRNKEKEPESPGLEKIELD